MAYLGAFMPRFSFFSFFLLFIWLQSHMIMAESPNSDAKNPRSLSSKALNIARSAKLELRKASPEATTQGIAILEELLGDASFRRLQIDERIDIYRSLAAAYLSSRRFQEHEALTSQLLKDRAFKPYWISLKATLGDSYIAQDNLIGASKVMKELLRTPKRRMSSEDADIVAALHTHLERYIELRLQAAQRLYTLKEYSKACSIYQALYDAAETGAFIKTYSKNYSKISFETFLNELSVRLANCYVLQNDGSKNEQVFWLLNNAGCLEANYPLFERIIYSLFEQGQYEKASQFLEAALLQLTDSDLIEKSHWLYIFSTASCKRHIPASEPDKPLWLCDQFLQKYPDSQFFADVLFQKAMILWQKNEQELALQAFSILDRDYAHAGHHDCVLFYMATLLQEKGSDARPLFLELATDYPDSKFAPESYYRTFSEHLYAAGDTQAIGHLKKMPKLYANTTWGVLATLYVAAFDREECPQKGLSAMQIKTLTDVIATLDEAIGHGNILCQKLPPKMSAILFSRLLQAQYERSECHFTLANFNEVLTGCDAVKENILILPKENRPHQLFQKAAFLKSRAFLLQGNESQAREELTNLVEYACNQGCETGEPLVLALIDLSEAFAREGNTDAAFALLNKAQIVQAEGTKEELLLEILIAKSHLHRITGELDKAMMLLSSVINERSASSLRIQAMFLRAELYELKGRRDLAFRQLQTTAKKGGEWGTRAAKKLEEKYGYE